MKWAAKADRNQPEIVKVFRKGGCSVASLHRVGQGVFDLLVAKHGLNILVEVKDGLREPSDRTLTPQQEKFHFGWQGMRCVVTCVPQALEVISQLDAMGKVFDGFDLSRAIIGSTEAQYRPKLS